VPPPAPEKPAVTLSPPQLEERRARCEAKARDRFQREAKEGTAGFAAHYNTRLDSCFYVLTDTRADRVRRKLVDLDENEDFGEYLGAADAEPVAGRHPDTCRLEAFYCASAREWQVLARSFMED
jgi:hypothetical protein